MQPLADSIKKTLFYFKLFNKPLTAEELFVSLWQPPSLSYSDFLKELSGVGQVENKEGFWFLPGCENIIKHQSEIAWLNDKKLFIAKRAVQKLRFIPFIRGIYVCNSVGMQLATKKSDIDFFIITAPHRVWLVRFFANIILRFLGLRVYGNVSQDKICLSFFVDEDNLDFSKLRIREDDVHFIYWFKNFIPLFDSNDCSLRLVENNLWFKKFLPFSDKTLLLSPWSVKDNQVSKIWKKFWEFSWQGVYGDILEKQARSIQESRIGMIIKDKNLLDGQRVVYNEGVIKLHQNDNREKIYQDWKSVC